MNQEKSNRASSPARLARLVTRISSPLQPSLNTSIGSIIGRLAGAEGSWISTRRPSHCASTTTRPSRISASAGRAANGNRCTSVAERLAFNPRCFAASSKSSVPTTSLSALPSWWRSAAGSAATWCNRAIRHSAARLPGVAVAPALAVACERAKSFSTADTIRTPSVMCRYSGAPGDRADIPLKGELSSFTGWVYPRPRSLLSGVAARRRRSASPAARSAIACRRLRRGRRSALRCSVRAPRPACARPALARRRGRSLRPC